METPLWKKKKLEPGIYIGSRRIGAGKESMPSPVGRHQFFLLVPREPKKFEGKLVDLGDDVKGMVVGAYPRGEGGLFSDPERLRYHRNAPTEIDAVRAYLGKLRDPDYAARFETQLSKARHQGADTDEKIRRILELGREYRYSERKKPVWYPRMVWNALGYGRNSNAFVQTVADLAELEKRRRDFPGFDLGHDRRLPKELFGMNEMKKEAYYDGYMNKQASGWSEGLSLPYQAAKKVSDLILGSREAVGKSIDQRVDQIGSQLQSNIETGVQRGVSRGTSQIQADVEEGVRQGASKATDDTWERMKPYVIGAGAAGVGLPLLLMGISVADRIALHDRLKKLQALQQRETELEEEEQRHRFRKNRSASEEETRGQ